MGPGAGFFTPREVPKRIILNNLVMRTKAWNKDYGFVKMACWNPWGLSNERLNYCRSLNFDVLGLPELHNVQNKKLWQSKTWITSEDSRVDEQGKNTDPAAGVAILLSQRFSKKILAQGAVESRIVWYAWTALFVRSS